MSIVLDESILGIWYVKLAEDFDLMIALSRGGDTGFKVEGRTRQYASPDDPWDEGDRKRWFSGGIPAKTEEEALKLSRDNMVKISTSFIATFGTKEVPALFELVRGTHSVEEFAKLLGAMPFAHLKEVTTH
ncbi:MAG TPA: hypothetical protein VFL19_03145 [Nitrospira sp.]|nr:hypothetical protein [Nitrospira sp.]